MITTIDRYNRQTISEKFSIPIHVLDLGGHVNVKYEDKNKYIIVKDKNNNTNYSYISNNRIQTSKEVVQKFNINRNYKNNKIIGFNITLQDNDDEEEYEEKSEDPEEEGEEDCYGDDEGEEFDL